VRERMMVVYKLSGYNVEKVMRKTYDKLSNVSYLHYSEEGDKIYMKWVDKVDDATKFVYDMVKWNELGWKELYDKNAQNKLLGK
jgi:hypothetical protein